jgi:hypothetical protein
LTIALSEEFGLYFARIPLETSAKIVCGNALEIDWEEVIPVRHVSYIMGNPPFSGAMVMSDQARADVDFVFQDLKGSGVLDYVACWYWLAAKFIYGTSIEVGFVSTNSICQGEQVGLLWQPILDRFKCRINFAHRTFKWNNEAKGKAAVHCVIIGFATHDAPVKIIYDYDTVNGKLHAIKAKNINPFLIDAPNVLLVNRKEPICQVPAMRFGSMPRDGGHFIFTEQERNDFLKKEPNAKKWIRPYTGAQEFINGYIRYCLWLNDIKPDELSKLHEVIKRVELVKEFRLASKAAATRRFARTSSLFCQIAQPKTDYLLVPRVSSERRKYIPIGFVNANVIANDQVLTVEDASFFHFGIISSSMHMAWVSYVCGRLKSDYRYSKDIVYNNFPWPENPTEKQKQAIEAAAQTVIDIRAQFPDSSLADLYDPLTMPPDLLNAHQQLDKSVDAVYGKTNFQTEDQRMAFLFELYQKYTSLFPPEKKRRSGC